MFIYSFIPRWKRQKYFLLLVVAALSALFVFGAGQTFATREPMKIIIDTDTGVDDAAAVGWLLSQTRYPVDILGITTVFGNTTAENAANNILTILDTAERQDIPVVIGATEPLAQPPSFTGASTHGPDGFWFVGWQNPHDLSQLPTDVPAFFCQNAAPDVTLVALGPLTNVAEAIATCPDEMQLYQEVIVLGGAKAGGNRTAVAEFNIWIDPEAAAQTFAADLPLRMVPLETFRLFRITQEDLDDLAANGTAVGQLLSFPLQLYHDSQVGLQGSPSANVPDITAVMIAVDDNFVLEQLSSLVKVVPDIFEDEPERILRGKTIIGQTFGERISMIIDDEEASFITEQLLFNPDFDANAAFAEILSREPDNAQVVTDIREQLMHRQFMHYLTD